MTNTLEQIKQAETMGAAAYLLGALNAIEAFSRQTSPATATALAVARKEQEPLDDDPIDVEVVEELKNINDAVDAARSNEKFAARRDMIVRRLWEPGARAELYDRFAAASVLGFLTATTAENIIKNVDVQRELNPGFVAYPYVSNRLKYAYLANGYNYPKAAGPLEPTPQRNARREPASSDINRDAEGRVYICQNN